MENLNISINDFLFSVEENLLTICRGEQVVYEQIFNNPRWWSSKNSLERIRKEVFDLGVFPTRDQTRKMVLRLEMEINKKLNEWETREKENNLKELIVDRDICLNEILEAAGRIGSFPREMLELCLATFISSQLFSKPPIWLMLVGSPSSMKTEIVKLFSLLDKESVYFLDTMSENAFASGYIPKDGSKTKDLLPLLNKKCFIVRDYTTLFSLNDETVKKILGDMASIFDEDFSKFTATRGQVNYKSYFSHIGCVTPAILNKHHIYVNQLGPRFLFYRVPDLTDEARKRGYEIAWGSEDRKKIIKEAQVLVSSFCYQLSGKVKDNAAVTIQVEEQSKLNAMADFVAKARGIAITRLSRFLNDEGKDISFYEVIDKQVEQPWRALLQIRNLAQCLALVRNKKEVSPEEIKTVREVVLSSMPVDRAEALRCFELASDLSSQDLGAMIGKSYKTAERLLRELESLGILERYKPENGAYRYCLDKEIRNNIYTTPDFVSGEDKN